ncbi:hypothetical protein C8R44DRAFT_805379 [Mycena epipterygia]|nr:hypothetical protein C8R44DRAFT_805379 [Mycena epipterygia]
MGRFALVATRNGQLQDPEIALPPRRRRRKLPSACPLGLGSSKHITFTPRTAHARTSQHVPRRRRRNHARNRVQPADHACLPRTPELPSATRPADRIRCPHTGFTKIRACMPQVRLSDTRPRISDAGPKSTQRWHRRGSAARRRDCMDDGGSDASILRERQRVLANNPEVERLTEIERVTGAGASSRWSRGGMREIARCGARRLGVRGRASTGFALNLIALCTFLFHSSATSFVLHLSLL